MDFQKTVLESLEQIKGQFVKVDERFDSIDERFNKVDERFNKVDERFDRMDERIDKMDEVQDLMAVKMGELCETTERLETVQGAMQQDLAFVKDAVEGLATRQKNTDLEVASLHSRVGRCEEKLAIV